MRLNLEEGGAPGDHQAGLCLGMVDAATHLSTSLVIQSAFLKMIITRGPQNFPSVLFLILERILYSITENGN